MSAGIQNVIVTVLVIAAALYAVWLLTPARPRLGAVRRLLRGTAAGDRPSLIRKALLQLERRALRRFESACGQCSGEDTSQRKR